MKLKTQFSLLISATILIPIVCTISTPIYFHANSSKRFLSKGFENTQKIANTCLTQEQRKILKTEIKKIPGNVDALVYVNDEIIATDFPEFSPGEVIPFNQILEKLKAEALTYKYQFNLINVERKDKIFNSDIMTNGDCFTQVVLITRLKNPDHVKNEKKIFYTTLIILIIFEFFSLSQIIYIYRSIEKSIFAFENSTKKIASGQLETKIELKTKTKPNEITSLLENLEKMRLALIANQEKHTKFIMGISHDLRTPVAVIKGYAEGIKDGLFTSQDQLNKASDIICTKAKTLEDLINDLISYEKLSDNNMISSAEKMPFCKIFDNYTGLMKSTEADFRRKFIVENTVNENSTILINHSIFTRLMDNIVGNAIRYTKENDVISIIAEENEKNIILHIKDTGCGIEEKDLSHIFELFYRGTSSRRERGFGIGLSVVKTICECMEWNIEVKSKINEGTEFTISIPKTYDKN